MRLVLAFLFSCRFCLSAAAFVNDDFGDLEIGISHTISWNMATKTPVTLNLLAQNDATRADGLKNPTYVQNIAPTTYGNNLAWKPPLTLNSNPTYVVHMVDVSGVEQLSKPFKLVRKPANFTSSSSLPSITPKPTSTTGSRRFPYSATKRALNETNTSELEPTSSVLTANSISQHKLSVRIAISMTIVTLLIFIVVALIFFEYGKRVACQKSDIESAMGSGLDHDDRGNGSDGLQLFEGFHVEDPKSVDEISATSTSCKNCSVEEQTHGEVFGPHTEEEAKRRKMKSMRSIYELG